MIDPSESGYPPTTWRLVVDGEMDGAMNMAVDEAILVHVVSGASLPTLRFYAWAPPCLSLGRNQLLDDVDRAACASGGVGIVRRPTGGRAILHRDELTYSVTLQQADPLAEGGIIDSYRRLSEGLVAGLHDLGADAIQARGQQLPKSDQTAVCFESPSDYEITVGGRKLVGSAQWRARGGVLQHGSLPLWGDLAGVVDYLVFDSRDRECQRQRVHRRALTLEEALGKPMSFAQVAAALAAGFRQRLNVTLLPGELTAEELALAAQLRAERYAAEAWTART